MKKLLLVAAVLISGGCLRADIFEDIGKVGKKAVGAGKKAVGDGKEAVGAGKKAVEAGKEAKRAVGK